MAEEIKITVSAPGAEATSAKMARLKKEAEELNRVADFRATTGDQTGAKFARQDAQKIEKELTTLTRQRAIEEKEITRERTKQAAEAKLTSQRGRRVAGAVANFAESQVGAGGFGGLTSALGSVGGVPGMIAAAIAAVGVGIAAAFAKQKDQEKIIGLEFQRDRTVQNYKLKRAGGFEGSSASSRSAAEGFKEEMVRKNANRQLLQKESEFKWYNPAGWFDKATGASENAKARNENNLKLDEEGLTKSRADTKSFFAKEGGLELQAMEARAGGLRKEARELERTQKWWADYNKALNDGADKNSGEASRIANAKMFETQVQQAKAISGHLGSNAGAAEIARVAGIATNPNRDVTESVTSLTAYLRSQHDETARQAWRHKFERTLNL